jgi:hypothetical protein
MQLIPIEVRDRMEYFSSLFDIEAAESRDSGFRVMIHAFACLLASSLDEGDIYQPMQAVNFSMRVHGHPLHHWVH